MAVRHYDPYADLINANRDEILKQHQEAIRRVRGCLERALEEKDGMKFRWENEMVLAIRVLDALNLFHPMHGESWKGWPEGSEP